MPLGYLLIHVVLFASLAVASAALTRKHRRAGIALAAVTVLAGSALQLCLLRFPRPFANAFGWGDLYFFSQFSLHIAAVAVTVAVAAQKTNAIRVRAAILGFVLLGLAAYASRTVFLAPPPLHAGAHEHPTSRGASPTVVRQSETSSCAPAAAATLLLALGIDGPPSEARLAEWCFTHPLYGTSDLGLYRGLRCAVPERDVRYHSRSVDELKALGLPCIVFVGLDRDRVPDPELFAELRDRCNWNEGEAHAVVCFGFDTETNHAGQTYDVAIIGDPNYGLERWGLEHFKVLWDGSTLEVR